MTVRELNDVINSDATNVVVCSWHDGARSNLIEWKGTAGELWYSPFIDCNVADLDISDDRFVISVPRSEVSEKIIKDMLDDAVLNILLTMEARNSDSSPDQERKLTVAVERLARCLNEIITNE